MSVDLSDRFPYLAFSSSSTLLLHTFVSILSLYRAIAPISYETLVSEVPALGMQFANDFEWIGDEVEIMWRNVNFETPHEKESIELGIAVNRMRQMGRDARERQAVSHVSISLPPAFTDLSASSQFNKQRSWKS